MIKILLKRTLRELKTNIFRYLALCLLVVVTIATLSSAESIIHTVGSVAGESNTVLA